MKTELKLLLLVAVHLAISACGNANSPQQNAGQVSAAASVRFTSGNSACRIPFQIVDELMIVPVTVNDSLQLDLIFDTGFGTEGAMLFDAEIGTALGLKYVSQAVLGGGGGADNKTANVAIGATLSLPGVIFSNQTLLVMTHKEAFKDWPVDGVIGRTLCNCLLEIDYENSILNLYDGIVAKPEDLGEEFQMKFSYGIPVVEATAIFDGGQALNVKLLVDTGFAFPLCLFTYSDEKIQLPPHAITVTDEGLNGEMQCQLARVSALKFGSFLFERPLTGFIDKSAMGSATILGQNGFFGHQAMQRFKVVFDYAGARMFLAPNQHYTGRFDFNMAGLHLKTLPAGELKVRDVVKDSPAARSGMRKDDLVVAIDDRDVKELDGLEIHRLFLEDGRKMELTVVRGTQQFKSILTLARLL